MYVCTFTFICFRCYLNVHKIYKRNFNLLLPRSCNLFFHTFLQFMKIFPSIFQGPNLQLMSEK